MRNSKRVAVSVTAVVAGLASVSQGAVAYSTTTVSTSTTSGANAFAAGYVIANPSNGTVFPLASETNQQQAELIQTFVPSSTFKLSQFSLLSGGKGGGTVTLHVYPINVTVTGQGGGNGDGFVNTVYSTDLLGGGAGLTATVFGSGGDQIVNFAFSGTDQVTLAAGTEYGFEVDSTATGNFSWERDAGGAFSTGNLYQAASGTQKTAVGGSNDRDGYFAIYSAAAAPEPTTLAALALGGVTLLKRRRRA